MKESGKRRRKRDIPKLHCEDLENTLVKGKKNQERQDGNR